MSVDTTYPLNPRSTLHALKPYGVGSPEVESLLSYFCRLAVSHSMSVASLALTVADALRSELRDGFEWHERNLSGMGESAQTWASGLSALTSMGNLHHLTLVGWRDVLAQSGLAATGNGRWCPQCLEEDRLQGRSPYFRLSWDIGAVTACSWHGIKLVDVCPDCGRTRVRHKAAYVVPGWCTHCGAFFGACSRKDVPSIAASPQELWVARQVEALLTAQPALEQPAQHTGLRDAIREVVLRMDGGKAAAFAKRIGVSKGTVHYWVHGNTIPTLKACLRICACSGLSLLKLLTGDLEGWNVPQEPSQLNFGFEGVKKREAPRTLDWEAIREELTRYAKQFTPISVAEAARRLQVDTRHLYLQANNEARVLGERWKAYLKRRGEDSYAKARPHVEAAYRALREQGSGISLRQVQERIPPEILASVERLFDMLQEIQTELEE